MRRVALCCFVQLRSAVVPMAVSIQELQESIRKFRDARDWLQFHNHKDMATALAIEAAELQELFLWKHGSEVEEVASTKRERLSEELADVAVYLLELAMPRRTRGKRHSELCATPSPRRPLTNWTSSSAAVET